MVLRSLAFAACALLATAAQARPEIEARAGAVDLGALGSATYLGLGLRHRFNDTWAAYGTFDKTVSSSGSFDVDFAQLGAHAEAGKEFGPVRVTLQLGMVYTEGEIGGFSDSSTAPAYGIELRFKRVSIGFSQTDYANQSITSTSLIFHF
jgi:hypothetical protein